MFCGKFIFWYKEGSYLGIPYVNIGNRQLNREKGHNVIDTNYKEKEIIKLFLNNYKLKSTRNLYTEEEIVQKLFQIFYVN